MPDTPEWPLTVRASRVTEEPLAISAEADADVRAALVRRFDILAIDALSAKLILRRAFDGDIAVEAQLRARLTQACVVSLEPVPEIIDVMVEGRFTERPLPEPEGDETVTIDLDDDSDEPEPIADGLLQVGEWLTQQLSLAMEPFPRAAAAKIDPAYEAPPEPDAPPTHRPFAGLDKLAGKKGEG